MIRHDRRLYWHAKALLLFIMLFKAQFDAYLYREQLHVKQCLAPQERDLDLQSDSDISQCQTQAEVIEQPVCCLFMFGNTCLSDSRNCKYRWFKFIFQILCRCDGQLVEETVGAVWPDANSGPDGATYSLVCKGNHGENFINFAQCSYTRYMHLYFFLSL